MHISQHLGRRIRSITRTRRSGAALAAASLTLGALAVVSAPAAQADLSAVSATFNGAGFPWSYTDANNVPLELCLDTAQCLGTTADMVAPEGEAFYYHASAELANGIVGFVALEAAFLEDEPIVFQRTQVDAPAGVFQPDQTYTITDPYGSYSCVGNADASVRTRCRIESGGGPNVFTDAVQGRIDRFMVSTAAPPGHIGDATSPTPVTGVTNPTFSVVGPGFLDATDQWIVQGRLAGPEAAPTPGATVSAADINFGGQPVDAGASATRTVTLRNSGNVTLSGISVSTGSAEYPATSTCGATLAPARECTISVGFDPAAAGPRAGVLTIASSAGNRTVSLSGRGQVGSLAFAPSSVDFGNVVIDRFATRVLTVRNAGDASMAFTSASLSGAGAGSFGLGGAAAPRCVSGTALAPGASCQLGVTFHPSGTGTRTATMQVTSGGTTRVLNVTGNGVTEAQAADHTRPTVASRTPGVGAERVSRTATIAVRFTEAVQGVGKATFKVINTRTHKSVTGRLRGSGRTWRLDPGSRLAAGTQYRVKLIGGSSAIRDIAGNALASQRWSFTTRG